MTDINSNIMITFDYRESKLINIFTQNNKYPFEVKNLDIGDIKISLLNNQQLPYTIILERKTISDLISSIKDGRYKEQKLRLLASQSQNINTKIAYLIEGLEFNNFSKDIDKSSIYGFMISNSFRDNIPIFQLNNIYETKYFIEKLTKRLITNPLQLFKTSNINNNNEIIIKNISSNIESNNIENTSNTTISNNVNKINSLDRNLELSETLLETSLETFYISKIKLKKKENLNNSSWWILILSQIPGVSVGMAEMITEIYPSLLDLIINYQNNLINEEEKKNLLSEIKINKNTNARRIGKVISERIYQFIYYKNNTS